jgi:hypothetical protein
MGCSDQQCGTGNPGKLLTIQTNVSASKHESHATNRFAEQDSHTKSYVVGSIQTIAGAVPQISSRLQWKDHLGAFKVRWGIHRDRYRVTPGLYAVGSPNERSEVLVTANYKLSFDTVRKNLRGLNVWLLVLDTKGVNVWCSAGKGAFGTNELVHRIQVTALQTIIQHKRIILPQLGAVGVAAHLVKESSGYTVMYGPVRAEDVPAFIQAGFKATKEMRRVQFGWYDRLKLVPNDLMYNLRYLPLLLLIFYVLSGIHSDGFSIRQASEHMSLLSAVILAGYVSGLVFTPLLLPYLYFRSFSFKGFFLGIIASSLIVLAKVFENSFFMTPMVFFLLSGISSFLAMNFTGASTYTSLAGVKKEMRIAVPLQIASGMIAAILLVLHGILQGK